MINDFFNILLPQGCLGFFILIQLLLAIFVSPKFYKMSKIISLIGIALGIVLLSTVQVEPHCWKFGQKSLALKFSHFENDFKFSDGPNIFI